MERDQEHLCVCVSVREKRRKIKSELVQLYDPLHNILQWKTKHSFWRVCTDAEMICSMLSSHSLFDVVQTQARRSVCKYVGERWANIHGETSLVSSSHRTARWADMADNKWPCCMLREVCWGGVSWRGVCLAACCSTIGCWLVSWDSAAEGWKEKVLGPSSEAVNRQAERGWVTACVWEAVRNRAEQGSRGDLTLISTG